MTWTIDADDLLKWAQRLDEIPAKMKPAVANALNAFGENVLRRLVLNVAEDSGIAPDAVRDLVNVKEATPDDWEWSADTQRLVPPSLDWSRPWDTRDKGEFDHQSIVKIKTMEDDKVCEECENAAKNSPYTLEEAYALRRDARGGDGLIHAHCRCGLMPWTTQRRLPVKMSGSGAPPELFTARQLGEAVAGALEVVIKAK